MAQGIYPEEIRKDFPIFDRMIEGKRIIYLDNAATTQKPQQVIDSIRDYYVMYNANIHRGIHKLSEESSLMYEDAHEKVGRFIGSRNPVEETIFLRNTTEAINLAMYGWAMHELKKGDEVLTTMMEHHSNIVPWQFLKEKGIIVKFADVDENGRLDMEDLNEKIGPKTRLVSAVHASNLLGTINPVKEIGKMAHENGSLFMVDAAQSVPHMPVDFRGMDADFLAFSGHKMLAPAGIGALIGKKDILEDMHPFMGGGDMIKEVKLDKSTWNELPWKFEAGTPNISGGIAFGAAVDYLKKLGMDDVRKHEEKLVSYAIEGLNEMGLKTYGPDNSKDRSGLVSFNIPGVHPHDVASILDSEQNIAIRAGLHCAQPMTERLGEIATNRASFYIYNTEEEIESLFEGLKDIKKRFKVA